jgi:alanine racemase
LDSPPLPAAGLRLAWAVVDLDALTRNLSRLRQAVGDSAVLAVVKADAYGHGALAVARRLEKAGVDWLGVALVEEGVELRRGGVETPILVLGTVQVEQLPLIPGFRLTPAISSLDQLDLWCEWLSGGETPGAEPQPCHLKVDTGMTRLGVPLGVLAEALQRIRRHDRLQLDGLLSHLACAEELDSPQTSEQEARFAQAIALLDAAERARVHLHLANSAGALHHPDSRHGLVRAGLSLYGVDPAGRKLDLEPVMSVRARVVQLREVPPGAAVGYGGDWVAARPSRIGVVPVGYADGYPWRLSGRSSAIVGGRRTPVVGRVSMDMITLDVTDCPAKLGGEVVLMGRQGEEEITPSELAEQAGTIPYEVLCGFGLRLPRLYLEDGALVQVASRFVEEGESR